MRCLHEWLAIQDPLPSIAVDAVIGFGHFDLGIPRRCLELLDQGLAKHILFTGGIGGGTADLGEPEAEAFLRLVRKEAPQHADRVIVESRSTNTAENIRFTEALLQRDHPSLAFGQGIRSVLLVATPCRQRRVWQTWLKLQPSVTACNAPPAASLEEITDLYAAKSQSILDQMLGEYQRIRDYPTKGWIAHHPIPQEIRSAAEHLSLQT
jgi:uncharacterized SAM-binding protein YcdF (DUF218 family)